MAPEDFKALSARRFERAQQLSERFEATREVLTFFAEVAAFQARIADAVNPCIFENLFWLML